MATRSDFLKPRCGRVAPRFNGGAVTTTGQLVVECRVILDADSAKEIRRVRRAQLEAARPTHQWAEGATASDGPERHAQPESTRSLEARCRERIQCCTELRRPGRIPYNALHWRRRLLFCENSGILLETLIRRLWEWKCLAFWLPPTVWLGKKSRQ